jgi:hypothetical protein
MQEKFLLKHAEEKNLKLSVQEEKFQQKISITKC